MYDTKRARETGQKWGGLSIAGIATFLRAPLLEEVDAKVLRERGVKAAVFGVPFDHGTIYRPGSSLGPRAVRDVSCYFGAYHADYDVNILRTFNLHDCGDSFIALGDAESTMYNGAQVATEILKAGAMPIILGGEHTVTLAGTLAIDKTLEGKYGFIHFDTHLDCTPEGMYGGTKWWQGAQVGIVTGLRAFPGENMVLVGMRGTGNMRPLWQFVKEHGITTFTMRQVLDVGIEKVVSQALEIATNGTQGFYLSIDMDVLEAAYAPGAMAFTPFGLTARELWSVLPKLGSNHKLVGFDVVEVVPAYDPSEVTALTAAGIVVEILAARASVIANVKAPTLK